MFAAILLIAGIVACIIAYACILTGARYDRARDKAWADFKPRPLRAYRDLGDYEAIDPGGCAPPVLVRRSEAQDSEPVHGAASTTGSHSAVPGKQRANSGSRA